MVVEGAYGRLKRSNYDTYLYSRPEQEVAQLLILTNCHPNETLPNRLRKVEVHYAVHFGQRTRLGNNQT